MAWIAPLAIGAAQLGMGIWQSIKTTRERKRVDAETKAQQVPGELYESKGVADELRQDALQTKGIQEGQAMDRDVMRRTVGAGVSSSPAGRVQNDIASNIEKGVDVNAIYADYRKSLAETAKLEMGINSEISRAKFDVFSQNMQVQSRNDDIYNRRQEAWAGLMNAGMSNVAGAFQSRQNNLDLNRYGDPNYKSDLSNKLNDGTIPINSDDYTKAMKYYQSGNYDAAYRTYQRYK
ncbi:MAG: hypothetical protein WC222_11355 [Parachlamydiales bacterium]|jgi:hypothetical protein